MAKRIRKYEGESLILKQIREKHWRDTNRLKGLCSCGQNSAKQGNKMCQECIHKSNKCRKERRSVRKQNNLCTECGNQSNGKNLCEKCKNYHKFIIDAIKQKRINEKICVRCGRDSCIANQQNCLICVLKGLSISLWKSNLRWKELLDLFDKQKGMCPYFKEPIFIGLDASLDHKVSKKLGGSNDISNLQWTHYIANTMKWDLTEEEFYLYIGKISDRKNS